MREATIQRDEGRSPLRWRPSLRTTVLAGSALVVVVIAVTLAVRVGDHLRGTATTSAIGNVEAIVRGYVDPVLSDDSLGLSSTLGVDAEAELDRLVASGDMRRINIWTRDGRIVYSTDPLLRGVRLGIDHELAEALAGSSVGEFHARSEDVEGSDALPDRYLELYVPIRGTTDGNPIGAFEVYLDAAPIERRVDETRRDVFLVTLAAGAALLGLLFLAFGGASRRLSTQNRRLSQLNEQLNQLAVDLRQREARFRSLVQNSSDVVTILDDRLRMVYESDAVRRVLGYEAADRLGEPFDALAHPDEIGRLQTFLTGLLATTDGEQTAEFRLRHADGSWRWVEAVGVNLSDDPAVGGVVLNYRDVTERKMLEQQLVHEAFHDPLTGLANRALFSDRVQHALSRTTRDPDQRLAVLFVDLDDFKVVNDSLGHVAGDELLVSVAERIRACLRRDDTAARLGGDEFAVLLEESDHDHAREVADRILGALRQPFTVAARQLFVQASTGIAMGGANDGEGRSAEELLRNADAAMYTAKSRGKGRHEFFETEMHALAMHRLELRGRLEASLAAGDFLLHFQPVVELSSGEIVGAEALIRWRQPDGRITQPADFIPLAEETGLIVPIGDWVLVESVRQAAAWLATSVRRPLSMALNVAPRQLQDATFPERVTELVEEAGLPASLLMIEVTESALLEVGEQTAGVISRLKELGVQISLDDFGTGYSSLSHLRNFPIDVLKIDRSFVESVDGPDDGERALVRSIIRLAHSMRLVTVAEGVERPTQVARLRALGARFGQGFHFGEPMEADRLTHILERRERLVG